VLTSKNPLMRQAFALAQAVPYRKNKQAIVHKLLEVLREAINQGGDGKHEDSGQCSITKNQPGDTRMLR
jgi:hypothetical protein